MKGAALYKFRPRNSDASSENGDVGQTQRLYFLLLASALFSPGAALADEQSDARSWEDGALHTTVFAAVSGGDRTVAVETAFTVECTHRGVLHLYTGQQVITSKTVGVTGEMRVPGLTSPLATAALELTVTTAAPDETKSATTSGSFIFHSPGFMDIRSVTYSPITNPDTEVRAQDTHRITGQ